MHRSSWLVLAVLWTGCSRSEEPLSSRDARSAGASGIAPSENSSSGSTGAATPTASAPPPPSCLVPSPDESPPKALPASECPIDPGPIPELPQGYVSFPGAPAAPRLPVELAREEAHRQRGLMYRRKLPADQGMLFSWPNEVQRTFWMQNTCIPLDMLFVALDGTILGILEQVPTLNEAPRTVPCPAAHVLEVNAGWARSHGVRSGMRLLIE